MYMHNSILARYLKKQLLLIISVALKTIHLSVQHYHKVVFPFCMEAQLRQKLSQHYWQWYLAGRSGPFTLFYIDDHYKFISAS